MGIKRLAMLIALSGASAAAWSSNLVELYQEAMAADPRIIVAESEVAIFQARERASFGRLLPQASMGAQGTRTRRDTTAATLAGELADVTSYYNGERYFFNASQPLYNKTHWEGYRSATKESDQYLSQLKDTRADVAVDLVGRYTQVLAAEDNHDFVQAELKAAQEQLKLVKARYDKQLASLTDLLSVEARANVLVSRELDARNTVQLAREQLAELLGREVTEPIAALRPQMAPVVDVGVLDDWISKALQDHEGLEARRLAVKAARNRVKEAQGRRHPTVNLSVSALKSDIGFENSQANAYETYVASVDLNIPLYSGGQVSAQVAEANARLRLAEQQYQQEERTLRREIRQAYLNTLSAQERVHATRTALESAEKSYEAQKKGFKYGTVTVVDVLDASETLFEARRDHRQALYDLMLESTTLYQSSGQFTAQAIVSIDAWLIEPGRENM